MADTLPTGAAAAIADTLTEGEMLWAQQLALHNTPERIQAICAAAVQAWRDKDAADLAALNADPNNPDKIKAVEQDAS